VSGELYGSGSKFADLWLPIESIEITTLDWYTEQHFIKLITQNNRNINLIPDESDRMVGEEDIKIIDSWINWVVEDLEEVGNEIVQSALVDLKFAPIYKTTCVNHHKNQAY
jgi:hypothetical protein